VVEDKFSEIGMLLPTSRIFGLGASNRQFKVGVDSTYTLFSKGRQNETMPADLGMGGTHGSQVQPFILGQTKNKKDWYGIFFMGGGAQSFEIVSVEGTDQVILNYITLADTIEFYIIMRGSAKDIISLYQHDIGFPKMPPYYALGIFAGSQSENWNTSEAVIANVQQYIDAKLPLEGVLVDTYTKDNLQPFTTDTLEGGFGSVDAITNFLRTNDMRIYLGVQTALPSDPDYYPHVSVAIDNFCLLNETHSKSLKEYTVGEFRSFWSNESTNLTQVAMVDQFADGAKTFYTQSIAQLANLTNGFDGLYLRGNTPFTNTNGSDFTNTTMNGRPLVSQSFPPNPEDTGDYTGYKLGGDQSQVSYRDIPFSPGYDKGGELDTDTVDMALIHSGFANYENPHPKGVQDFYIHNLNGLQMHKNIHEIMKINQTQRTNVYSESTWSGTGLYGGSWT
jgi:alpha-glucosidase (family GH31 glycosyl hydrolase)